MDFTTTICAPATPHFTGALAVIRVSGPQALSIVGQIFKSRSCPDLTLAEGYHMYYGEVVSSPTQILDQVVISVFRAPHSFTGEDSVEISCHGSLYIQSAIIQELLDHGAVMAGPGEFSQRAFLNGKMDLTQVEAVADLIASQNAGAHRLALQQLRGGFSKELAQLRSQLLELASLMELELDFAEEDVEFADRTRLKALLDTLQGRMSSLCATFKAGNAIKNGVPVAIVGAVNAGKSTLLNALIGQERAIVSPIAGTTRDTIEDTLVIDGICYRFVDTAGLRRIENAIEGSQEQIEQMGVERSLKALHQAAIVLLVLDVTRPETFAPSLDLVKDINKDLIILVFNKIDAINNISVIRSNEYVIDICKNLKYTEISAFSNTGIETLKTLLKNTFLETYSGAENTTQLPSLLLTNSRHYQELNSALESLGRVRSGIEEQLPTDLLTPDLRQVLYHVGAITGEISTDEILGNIFRNFCIGK